VLYMSHLDYCEDDFFDSDLLPDNSDPGPCEMLAQGEMPSSIGEWRAAPVHFDFSTMEWSLGDDS